MSELTLKTQLNEITTQKLGIEKKNKELQILIDSQDRLIKKLKKQNEEYILLLDELLRGKNER